MRFIRIVLDPASRWSFRRRGENFTRSNHLILNSWSTENWSNNYNWEFFTNDFLKNMFFYSLNFVKNWTKSDWDS